MGANRCICICTNTPHAIQYACFCKYSGT